MRTRADNQHSTLTQTAPEQGKRQSAAGVPAPISHEGPLTESVELFIVGMVGRAAARTGRTDAVLTGDAPRPVAVQRGDVLWIGDECREECP